MGWGWGFSSAPRLANLSLFDVSTPAPDASSQLFDVWYAPGPGASVVFSLNRLDVDAENMRRRTARLRHLPLKNSWVVARRRGGNFSGREAGTGGSLEKALGTNEQMSNRRRVARMVQRLGLDRGAFGNPAVSGVYLFLFRVYRGRPKHLRKTNTPKRNSPLCSTSLGRPYADSGWEFSLPPSLAPHDPIAKPAPRTT